MNSSNTEQIKISYCHRLTTLELSHLVEECGKSVSDSEPHVSTDSDQFLCLALKQHF